MADNDKELLEELEIHNREFIKLIRELNTSIKKRSEQDLTLTQEISKLASKELAIPDQIKAVIENPTKLTIPEKQKVEVDNWPTPPDSVDLKKPDWWEEYPLPLKNVTVDGEVSIKNLPEYPKDVNLKQPSWWKEPKETDIKGLKEHLTFLFEGFWKATKKATQRVKITNKGSDEVVPVILYTPEGEPYTILSHGGSGGGGGGTSSSVAVTSLTRTVANLDHGSNLDIDTSAEQITATSFSAKKGVAVKADAGNSGVVYIGNSDVTAGDAAATDGVPLSAGESIEIEIDNPNKLYAIASTADQKVYWMAL